MYHTKKERGLPHSERERVTKLNTKTLTLEYSELSSIQPQKIRSSFQYRRHRSAQ